MIVILVPISAHFQKLIPCGSTIESMVNNIFDLDQTVSAETRNRSAGFASAWTAPRRSGKIPEIHWRE